MGRFTPINGRPTRNTHSKSLLLLLNDFFKDKLSASHKNGACVEIIFFLKSIKDQRFLIFGQVGSARYSGLVHLDGTCVSQQEEALGKPGSSLRHSRLERDNRFC